MNSHQILGAAIQIDGICDRFEDAWKANPSVRIESYLPESTELADRCLQGLLRLEISLRRNAKLPVDLLEYAFRFPNSAHMAINDFKDKAVVPENQTQISQFVNSIVQSTIRSLNLRSSTSDNFRLSDVCLAWELQSDQPYHQLGWLALIRRAIGITQSLQTIEPTPTHQAQLADLTETVLASFSSRRQTMLRASLSGIPLMQAAKSNGFTQGTLTQSFRTLIQVVQ